MFVVLFNYSYFAYIFVVYEQTHFSRNFIVNKHVSSDILNVKHNWPFYSQFTLILFLQSLVWNPCICNSNVESREKSFVAMYDIQVSSGSAFYRQEASK